MRPGLALLLSLTAMPAGAADTELPAGVPSIRLSELRDLPDRQLVRRVFGPLELFPFVSSRGDLDGALHRPPRLWLWSRPRAGGHSGMCRTQRLIVYFERNLLDVSGRNDPSYSPAGFVMDDYFIVENREEALQPFAGKQRDRRELDAACSKLDPRRDGIPADSAFQLVRALKLVEALGDGARTGKAPAPLDCTRLEWGGEPPADEAACLRELTGLGDTSVHWVQDCAPKRAAPGGCTQVLTYRWFIEFDHDVGGKPILIVLNALEDMSQVH